VAERSPGAPRRGSGRRRRRATSLPPSSASSASFLRPSRSAIVVKNAKKTRRCVDHCQGLNSTTIGGVVAVPTSSRIMFFRTYFRFPRSVEGHDKALGRVPSRDRAREGPSKRCTTEDVLGGALDQGGQPTPQPMGLDRRP
jgi:hypothetical protein